METDDDAGTAAHRGRADVDEPGSEQPSDPTASRIVLGAQLRRLREASGVSRDEAAEAIRASDAKISRLELGRVSFKERDVADLMTLYGVTDEDERAAALGLMRQANARSWWQQHSDLVPTWFETYLRLEQTADVLRTYQLQFVPGLLQSEEYARAVILQGHRNQPIHEVDRRVRMRMDRQKILQQPDGPQLWAVIDEAALTRPFAAPRVMRGQLEHLLAVGAARKITIQVLPFDSGAHAAAGGSFTILRFGEPDLPDVVYLEQLTSATYLDRRADLETYQTIMDRISVQAETPEESAAIIRRLIDRF